MPLQGSGTITMAQINAEFGRGNNLNSYRGTTYYTSSAGPFTFPSGLISFSNFYGTQLAAPFGTFNPDGSTDSGSPVVLQDLDPDADAAAAVGISCTQSVQWNWARTSGATSGWNVTVANGSSATSITFAVGGGLYVPRSVSFSCNANAGAGTRYWTIQLTATAQDPGGGPCPTCCFTPDTLITMADGSLKPIVDIQVGDLILCQDAATGVNVITTVTGVITRVERAMYQFQFANGTVLNASEDHPLFTLGKGWASVGGFGEYKDLGTVQTIAVGDHVVGLDGASTEILSIEQIDFPGTVYTLGNSRFYANGVLVY